MGAFELAAVVPAADERAVRAAARAPRGARQRIFRLYEWFDRTVFGAARAMRDTDLSRIARGRTSSSAIRTLDAVVSFCPPSTRLGWSGPPRSVGDRPHGRWPTYQRVEPLLGASPGQRHRDRSRCKARRRLHARDRARLRARRSTVADAHAERRRVDPHASCCTLAPAPADGGLVPTQNGLGEPRNVPPPAVTVRHAARTAVRGGGQEPHMASRRVVCRGAPAIDGRASPRSAAHAAKPRGPLPGGPVPH